MRVLITAGPTREYIDAVRFLSNASSGRMGCAVAEAAAEGEHEVTLLLGQGATVDVGAALVKVVRFTSVEDLQTLLVERFPECDALVMTAAVGDFRVQPRFDGKIPRAGGPIDIHLVPTEDILAGVAATKQPGQTIVAFAVEQGEPAEIEAKARGEMQRKGSDFVVVNTPEAMAAESSLACILSPAGVALPWATRTKAALAGEIIGLLETRNVRADS